MSVAVTHKVYTSKASCFYWPSLPACKCLFSSAYRIADCSPWSTENWRWQLQQVLMDCHRPHLAIMTVPIPHPFKPNHCPVSVAERCYKALFIFSRVSHLDEHCTDTAERISVLSVFFCMTSVETSSTCQWGYIWPSLNALHHFGMSASNNNGEDRSQASKFVRWHSFPEACNDHLRKEVGVCVD